MGVGVEFKQGTNAHRKKSRVESGCVREGWGVGLHLIYFLNYEGGRWTNKKDGCSCLMKKPHQTLVVQRVWARTHPLTTSRANLILVLVEVEGYSWRDSCGRPFWKKKNFPSDIVQTITPLLLLETFQIFQMWNFVPRSRANTDICINIIPLSASIIF